MATFSLFVRSLVSEPGNVIEVKCAGEGNRHTSYLLSPREARRLAEMLLDVADQADELPVIEVWQ